MIKLLDLCNYQKIYLSKTQARNNATARNFLSWLIRNMWLMSRICVVSMFLDSQGLSEQLLEWVKHLFGGSDAGSVTSYILY